jgi:hypothetical protein
MILGESEEQKGNASMRSSGLSASMTRESTGALAN